MDHSTTTVIPATEPNAEKLHGLRIGEVLVARGVITRPQLDSALEEQREQGGRIGPIIASLGYASLPDIERYSPRRHSSKLGQRLLENNLISREQLQTSLEYQIENGGLLGNILVTLGYVTKDDVHNNLMPADSVVPIGETLVRSGFLTLDQLNKAMLLQQKSGGLLGDILLSLRFISLESLYRALATQQRIGRAGKRRDFSDSKKLPFELARKYSSVIVGRNAQHYLVAVPSKIESPGLEEIERAVGMPVEQVLASKSEIDQFWNLAYPQDLTEESTLKLAKEQPRNSAIKTFTFPQIGANALLLAGCVLGLVYWKESAAIVINALVQSAYFIMFVFKIGILSNGLSRDCQIRISDPELKALDESKLPVYTILIPLYKEKAIASKLLNNVERLDYPKSKLDIRLLLEADDTDTIETIRSLNLPDYYTLLIVPPSEPRTKPKACNYGLINAKGKYVVIFDAEDKPEPDQLKKVVLAFARLPEKCVCIQAKLNYYNSKENLLTRWFTLEYSMWFELLLPGAMQLDIPLPLGGTSNHFKTDVLKLTGAWDPFNVTEDADLGIRLFKQNHFTAVIASRTWEEAPVRLGTWIKQRSRWIKGYMQTWLVHMRNPFRLYRELGLKGFLGFQAMLFGTFFLPLANPVLWIMMIIWFATKAAWISQLFPGPMYYAALLLLVGGNSFFIYSAVVGMYWTVNDVITHQDARSTRAEPLSYEVLKSAAGIPLYWILLSLASYRALWQLIFKPNHWEKTAHGHSADKHDTVGDFINPN